MRTQRNPVSEEPVSEEPSMEVKEIPPKQVYNHNLKKIKSYRRLRQSYKINNAKAVFVKDMHSILECFKVEDHKLDCELLVEVLNIAESFFIYGNKEEREHSKQEAVKTLMLPFFLNDELVLDKTIANVWYKVVKSNSLKRCWRKLLNFFCFEKKK